MTLIASVLIFGLCAYERYVKVTTPLQSLQPRTLKKMYTAAWASAIVAACSNFLVGGYRMVPSGFYCVTDFSQWGTFILLFVFVILPLVGSAYSYFKIYLRLKSLGRSRVGEHSATRTEADIAMKMLLMMLLFVACWTPAVVMMCWRILARPNSDHPLIDLWSSIGCTAAGFLTPLLNCVLFEHYRTAVVKRIPLASPFLTVAIAIIKKGGTLLSTSTTSAPTALTLGATTMLGNVYADMSADEAAYKERFDEAWAKLCAGAGPSANAVLFDLLSALVQQDKSAAVAQEDSVQSVAQLMELSYRHNKRVQSVFKSLADECGAEYKEGPVKDSKRVKAKMDSDYESDVRRVVDTGKTLWN